MPFIGTNEEGTNVEQRVAIQARVKQGQEALAWRQQGFSGWLKLAAEIFKVRIVFLLLWAAFGGAFLAQGGVPTLKTSLVLLVSGGLASGGASGLNQYLERESDAAMPRTRNRPLVRGSLANPEWVLWISLAMILAAGAIGLSINLALAFFLMLGALIYVGVYTLWLKPRSILNIVIGGAAGSAAVLSGGAALGAWRDPFVISLALLVFLWTPAHFWSLSLLHRSDYQQGGFPMLPAVASPPQAAGWVLLHALATSLVGLLLASHLQLGFIYFLPTLGITVWFLHSSLALSRKPQASRASHTFMASNYYLVVILAALMLELAI
jgi:protoheme IX farnesyltransferase